VFGEYVNKITEKNSTMIIKFLDRDILNNLLSLGETITEKSNFVRFYGSTKKIKYYYSHAHHNPIIENIYSKEDILKIVGKNWKIKEYINYDHIRYITAWENYFRSFSVLVLEKINS
jgi:hypothetical protein